MASWFENLIRGLQALPPARRAMLALAAFGSLAFFGWLTLAAATPEYRALYRGLAEDEAARVIEALAAEKIGYEVGDAGTSVLVPASEMAEARIRMAGRGLPNGGGAGFELFDRPAFGVTDFVHRVNYMRAVQGELARSIEQLDPVERARVQVVVPERGSVLAAQKRAPRASVVVRLVPGQALAPDQAKAIVHLVASSIESLDPEDVTVVDGSGRLLAPIDDSLPGSVATAGATTHQQRVEAELSERVEGILEKTVGPGGVVARVRAELDWTEMETTEETFDPDSQVARSEQRTTELSQEEGRTGGVPGVAANAPDTSPGSLAAGTAGSSRTEETVNYEISKTVSRRVVPMGQVERLSIAVLVADRPGEEPDAPSEPWDADALALFEALARQAVGFNEKRGDQITVQSAPFRLPEQAPLGEPSFWPQWGPLLVALVRGLIVLVALVLFARLVVKPVTEALPPPGTQSLPARVEDLESELALSSGAGGQAALPAGPNVEDGTRALRNWLQQG